MARLTYRERKRLPKSAFGCPGRRFPIHDRPHVRNAIARMGQSHVRGCKGLKKKVCKKARELGIASSVCGTKD